MYSGFPLWCAPAPDGVELFLLKCLMSNPFSGSVWIKHDVFQSADGCSTAGCDQQSACVLCVPFSSAATPACAACALVTGAPSACVRTFSTLSCCRWSGPNSTLSCSEGPNFNRQSLKPHVLSIQPCFLQFFLLDIFHHPNISFLIFFFSVFHLCCVTNIFFLSPVNEL